MSVGTVGAMTLWRCRRRCAAWRWVPRQMCPCLCLCLSPPCILLLARHALPAPPVLSLPTGRMMLAHGMAWNGGALLRGGWSRQRATALVGALHPSTSIQSQGFSSSSWLRRTGALLSLPTFVCAHSRQASSRTHALHAALHLPPQPPSHRHTYTATHKRMLSRCAAHAPACLCACPLAA